jgi:hypothetical protein
MTRHPDLFAALAAPFEHQELKARSQQGRQLHYVTARTVMNRLDTVLGPENWWDEYVPSQNSVLCRLTIRLPDGSTLTKSDAGGYAGMADSGDDDKSGYSDAFKRAAVKFGVGRYLYRDGVALYASQVEPGCAAPDCRPHTEAAAVKPEPAASDLSLQPHVADQPRPESIHPANASATAPAPRTGRALFAWAKEQDQRYGVGLLKYLTGWAKLQVFPPRMVDWDADQVARGHSEGCHKLQLLRTGHSEAYEQALAN